MKIQYKLSIIKRIFETIKKIDKIKVLVVILILLNCYFIFKNKIAQLNNNIKKLNYLIHARNAFLEDQKTIIEIISKALLHKNISIVPLIKSKYQQAFDLIKKTDKDFF